LKVTDEREQDPEPGLLVKVSEDPDQHPDPYQSVTDPEIMKSKGT